MSTCLSRASLSRAVRLAAATALAFIAACATTPSDDRDSATSDAVSLQQTPPELFTDTTPLTAPGAKLLVHGMSCPKCVSNVDLTLQRLDGVRDVAINMRDGIVEVSFEGEVRPSPQQIAKAVDDAGLTLVRIESRP